MHENGLLDDLSALVGFPTVSDRELVQLAEWIANRFGRMGFRVERFPDPDQRGKCSLVMTAGPDRTDGSGIILSGHMDVVPTEGQPWTSDPFALTRRGDRVYGRGTADMKGFFAVALAACDRIAAGDRIRDLRAPIVLVWTHDEEVGCLGSAQLCTHLADRPLPRACWIGEPTGFRTLRMHPGHVGVEIEVRGRAAHSSRPKLGVNAIDGAAAAIRAVGALAEALPDVPFNVARIAGGTAINIVPDRCVVQLGFRPPPGVSAESIHDRIADAIAAITWPEPMSSRILRITPSLLTADDTPLGTWLAPHSAPDPDYQGMAPFATDGGNLMRLGTAPLVFGPGDIEVAHKADEFVEIGALVKAVDIAERVLHSACG